MSTITHVECWKKTALGTPIPLFSSRPLPELTQERPILLFGGVHGDEPEGVRLAEETLRAVTEWSKSVWLTPWIIIPVLNVDGFKAGTRVNGRGVDLNRNYPSQDWSPHADQPRYSPGPSAMSEPEVAGIVELIDLYDPRIMIHCHSWEPCIVATGARAQTDGTRLALSSGYPLKPEIGYPTPGSLSRFGWFDRQIPVICIEERDKLEDLSTIWSRFEKGMRSVFTDHSPRRRLQPEVPPVRGTS